MLVSRSCPDHVSLSEILVSLDARTTKTAESMTTHHSLYNQTDLVMGALYNDVESMTTQSSMFSARTRMSK
jgi:phosphohistidine phosphatase SixA